MQEAGPRVRLLASSIADVLEHEGISQAELGKRLGISQSSVSRALSRPAKRNGRAQARLVTFMHEGGVSPGVERFQGAFRRVWDGSEEHAEALARIIAACEGLAPDPRAGESDDE